MRALLLAAAAALLAWPATAYAADPVSAPCQPNTLEEAQACWPNAIYDGGASRPDGRVYLVSTEHGYATIQTTIATTIPARNITFTGGFQAANEGIQWACGDNAYIDIDSLFNSWAVALRHFSWSQANVCNYTWNNNQLLECSSYWSSCDGFWYYTPDNYNYYVHPKASVQIHNPGGGTDAYLCTHWASAWPAGGNDGCW